MVVLAMFARQAVITMDVNLLIVAASPLGRVLRTLPRRRRGRGPLPQRRVPPAQRSYAAPLIWARCLLVVCALLDYCLLGMPKLLAPSPMQLPREHDRAGTARPLVHSDEPRHAAHA
jgi:hypothetical protein